MISETGTAGPRLFDDPILKRIPKSRDRVPKKYIPPTDKLAKLLRGTKHHDHDETVDNRPRRSIKEPKFTRHEKLDDDGEVILEWDPSDDEMVTFKVTAKTLGYVGIGFNEKNHMKGADILLAWVDDHTGTVNLLSRPPDIGEGRLRESLSIVAKKDENQEVCLKIRGSRAHAGTPSARRRAKEKVQKEERNELGLTESFGAASSVNTWRSPDLINFSISSSGESASYRALEHNHDSHGIEDPEAALVTDTSQDVKVLGGSQNETHTSVIFSRNWQTCDPQDHRLTGDTIRVLWALHPSDPELNTAIWPGDKRGGRALRLKTPAPHAPPRQTQDIKHWDVKLNQPPVSDNVDTTYWCKIFKAPHKEKHHMIGYTPLVEKENEDLVHHIILYECASTLPILGQHARIVGASCYSPTMPLEWESCLQPVLAWARGSTGEWLPEHVGIPIAEHAEGSYYMLEVHYNNPTMKKVVDSSGVRLHLTPKLRPEEAGILVAGVAVSPLHLIPPRQKAYATAGYCTPHCTNTMFPEEGVNVVSVALHSHLAGRRLSLKHIRQGKELPRIVQDNHFDFEYQQSHTLEKEVKVLPGDELVAECVYGTLDRTKPTLGGYAASQEMCLAFVVHYPRTPLAACYSMTPVKHLFKTLGVYSFKGVTMDHLEKLFLTTRADAVSIPFTGQQQLPVYPATRASEEIDEDIIKEAKSALRAMRDYTVEHENDNVFSRLTIEDPEEFRGRTLAEHMLAMPWTEELLARSIEKSLYHGRHMTFCRKRDDKLALPADIQTFPNYTALPETNETTCSEMASLSVASRNSPMWSVLISCELNLYRIAADSCGYKSPVPWDREHQQLSGAPRRNTRNPYQVRASKEPNTCSFTHSEKLSMRRTRYVALPVRAWQYVGLLVVSLACLTLGLVSRDKEGRAGSLAGPELEHRAPHEVDACPNLTPFTKLPSFSSLEEHPVRISKTTRDTRDSRTSMIPSDLRMSRSRRLDRVSRTRLQSRVDFGSVERLDKERRNTGNDFSRRALESRARNRIQDTARRSSDPAIRLSRSLGSRSMEDLAEQRLLKRSTDSDRRREVNRRMNESHLVRSTERLTGDIRRERNDRSLRNVDRRSRIQTMKRDSRLNEDRRSLTRMERREVTDEPRERINRLDRRMDARSNERRDSLVRLVKRSADDLERRQRTKALERRESRIVRTPQVTRNDLNQLPVRHLSSDRRSERRVLVDSRRSSERRSVSAESRVPEEVRAERKLGNQRADRRVDQRTDRRFMERRTNSRLVEQRTLGRTLERRSASLESRNREENRADRLVEQRKVGRTLERRSASLESRNREENRADRRLMDRRADQRLMEQKADRRLMEQRSLGRSSERRSASLESRNREENRADRRLIERKTDRRLIEQRTLGRSSERRSASPESRADRRLVEQRTLGRTSEMRSVSLESRNRKEIRGDRRLMDQRADQRLKERRADQRLMERRADRRLMERRTLGRSLEMRSAPLESRNREEIRADRRLMDQRADQRLMERRTDRRLMEQRANRRLMERRTLGRTLERRSASLESRKREEIKTDRRLMDQRADRRLMERRTDRRLMEQRADRRLMERRTLGTSSERRSASLESRNREEIKTDRRLMDQRADRRLMERKTERRLTEQRADRRFANERLDRRDLDSRRSLRQRLEVNRLQRTRSMPTLLANNVRSSHKEQNLADGIRAPVLSSRDRSLNDAKRSRSMDRESVRSSDKRSQRDVSEDSSLRRQARSSRLPVQQRNTRSLASREKVLTRTNDFAPRMKTFAIPDFVKKENSTQYVLTFEVIRQALVIGLCTMYGLSIFYGKRSFIR
ncbi:MOXD1 like protein 1 [Habropoda laboriosa]|uniref:MOXD1 like protein 1 n=1 Tax=Habropoda laboriosa TaxID=597456 RepID=A0A0L7RD13_9HYME|nr:MOXD1 like protein 1 [Habropoda laboriosa]